MFEQHNKLTRLTYILVGINGVVSVYATSLFYALFVSEQPVLMWLLLVISVAVLVINLYLAFKIYQKSVLALKWTAWLYAIHIISFETEDWAYSVSSGLQFELSWRFDTGNFAIDLMAIFISVLAYIAYGSALRQQNKAIQNNS